MKTVADRDLNAMAIKVICSVIYLSCICFACKEQKKPKVFDQHLDFSTERPRVPLSVKVDPNSEDLYVIDFPSTITGSGSSVSHKSEGNRLTYNSEFQEDSVIIIRLLTPDTLYRVTFSKAINEGNPKSFKVVDNKLIPN